MTAARQSLIDDAREAGYVVTQDGEMTLITKRVGRWQETRGLVLFGCGTAILADVRLDIAKGIRSYREMREALGLESARA